MKVDKLDGLTNPQMLDIKINADKGKGVDFQKILAEAQVNRVPARQQLSKSGQAEKADDLLDGPWAAYSLAPLSELGKDPQVLNQNLRTADHTLGLLEEYQNAMADPKVSLKSLYPYIQSLSHEIKDINQVAEKLSASDPFKKILGEIGVLVAVEVEKFNRGDYVP
jgi:hypothetical protein